jgi:hypothetical protein
MEVVQIEFYTTTLPPPVAMLLKSKQIRTLEDNFVEAIKVEKDLAAISNDPGNEESESSTSEKNGKKKKEAESDGKDMVIFQFQNEIMNLEMSKGERKKLVKKKNNANNFPQSILLQESTSKIMRWKTFVVHIMKIIRRKHVHISLIYSRK